MDKKIPTNVVLPENSWQEVDLSFLEKGEEIKAIDYVYTFGEKLAEYIEQMSKRSSCSKEYVMLILLVIASTIIGNKRRVLTNGWDEPTHLWGALVGRPSCRKSAAMTPFYEALKPLAYRSEKEYQRLKDIYLDRVKSIKAKKEDKEIWDDLIKRLDKPILKQIVLNDTTTEALCRVINPRNPSCVCVFRDELVGLMKNLEKYNKGDKSLYLEGYNGRPYSVNRVGLDEPILISELSISILGGIQPEKLAPILRDVDDGFISRFLFVYSEPTKINILDPSPDFDINFLQKIFNKLDEGIEGKAFLRMSNDALIAYQEFLNENYRDGKLASGLLESSYGKSHGLVVRLSCVLEHLSWAIEDNANPPLEITEETIRKSIDLMELYFKPMTGKIISECSNGTHKTQLLYLLIKHLAESKEKSFNWRTLVTNGSFRQLRGRKKEIIDVLTENNIVRRIYPTGVRADAEFYEINPRINTSFTVHLRR